MEQRVENLISSFGYESDHHPAYATHYRAFESNPTLEAAGFRVSAVPAHHHPSTHPFMLRIELERRSVFFTGDTGPETRKFLQSTGCPYLYKPIQVLQLASMVREVLDANRAPLD